MIEKCMEVFALLYRKIESYIREFLLADHNKVLLVEGARQIGKSYIIRKVGNDLFENYIELNMAEDKTNARLFEHVTSTESFYIAVSSIAGERMNTQKDTLIFIDEIQEYPNLLTLLKFLKQENKYTYVASGSLLGLALAETTSIPIGSIQRKRMYQLDFEEFLIANGCGENVIAAMYEHYKNRQPLEEGLHNRIMDLFRRYLIVGGMPDCVNTFLETRNVAKIREIQSDIIRYYRADASKRDAEKKLKIGRIYDMLPSFMQNTKKRIVVKDIENIKGKRFSNYADEFDYLINSGIANDVKAISNPVFPLCQSEDKNLLKLYMNDVGLLSCILFQRNTKPILDDIRSVNLGALYETAVALQLRACGNERLFYYDNRKNGEVDFLVDNYENLSVLPIEVKSGRDYRIHSAIDRFVQNEDYPVQEGIVLCNDRDISVTGKITHMPIYFVIFMRQDEIPESDLLI